MTKLDYSYLIGKTPVVLDGICTLSSPKLSSIYGEKGISYPIYSMYLSAILCTKEDYYIRFEGKDEKWLQEKHDDEKSLFSLITNNSQAIQLYENALNFFLNDIVVFDENAKIFLTFDGTEDDDGLVLTGVITEKTFTELCGIIAQLNGVSNEEIIVEEKPRFKNKSAQKLYEKIQANKRKQIKTKKEDRNMQLTNLISAVSSKSNSYNYLNIWDLTICQFYDEFRRLVNNTSFDITSTSVAVWGDEKGKFNMSSWYESIFN